MKKSRRLSEEYIRPHTRVNCEMTYRASPFTNHRVSAASVACLTSAGHQGSSGLSPFDQSRSFGQSTSTSLICPPSLA